MAYQKAEIRAKIVFLFVCWLLWIYSSQNKAMLVEWQANRLVEVKRKCGKRLIFHNTQPSNLIGEILINKWSGNNGIKAWENINFNTHYLTIIKKLIWDIHRPKTLVQIYNIFRSKHRQIFLGISDNYEKRQNKQLTRKIQYVGL